jgi:putative hemolysin
VQERKSYLWADRRGKQRLWMMVVVTVVSAAAAVVVVMSHNITIHPENISKPLSMLESELLSPPI